MNSPYLHEAAAANGEQPVEWGRAPALFAEQPATPPTPARRSPVTPLSPKMEEATPGDTTTVEEPPSPTSLRSLIPTPLSPKTEEATARDTTPSDTTANEATTAAAPTLPADSLRSPIPDPRSPVTPLSPKTEEATPGDTTTARPPAT